MTATSKNSKVSLLAYRACDFWNNDQKVKALPLIAEVVRRAKETGELDDVATIVKKCGFAIPSKRLNIGEGQQEVVEAATLAKLAAPETLQSFRGDAAFPTWVKKIADNCAINMIRSNDRQTDGQNKLRNMVHESGERWSSFGATKADFDKARNLLSEEDQTYLDLWIRFGDFQTIADEIGGSYSTVRHRVIRSRANLDGYLKRPGRRS